ncbi:exosortase V [Sphingomonas glaciei]|uniref:Exosortase V n=1 Tax=Sphingomonas glaciei TaxID=2938948 RepID=A0ABY5MR35_9SPHN|nr:exosortase V [Sphingomonas glaciei]UUR06955.1 exosortase V [Sphingomonas glaciei]
MLLVREREKASGLAGWQLSHFVLIAAFLLFVVPPMIEVARFNWTTEQGGHGPIVMATGLWLLYREYTKAKHLAAPGNRLLGFGALLILVPLYIVAGITGILELQVFLMYAAVVAAAYLLVGGAVLRACWFPILYLAFALPPPDQVVAVLTQPVKIAISGAAVKFLYALGYPIGSSGVMIQIAQFELLVAAACSGLNSLLTLSAICMFYVYLKNKHDRALFIGMAFLVLPIAVLANFIRVLILILITYYAGEAAAQGFLHDFAGLLTFAAALATLMAIEALVTSRRKTKPAAERIDG